MQNGLSQYTTGPRPGQGVDIVNKAQEAATAIKAAIDKTNEVMHCICIMANNHGVTVQVQSLDDLEQVPGEERRQPFSHDYPVEAYKMVDGVKFFCLLTAEEVKKGA
jgi:hypothetical protein